MSIIDNILEDKRRAKLIIVLSLIIFFLGFAAVFIAGIQKDNIVAACNSHWKIEIENNYGNRPNFIIGEPMEFNLSLE